MLIVVVTMFVVLFAFLAGGLWIGWTLAPPARFCWRCSATSARQASGAIRLEHPHHPGTAGAAAVHPDGEILFRTRLSQALFSGLAPWAGLLPGRLLHVNVIGCTIFAAISGSSAATTQVVGRISLAELLKRGYSKDVAVGSLAGAGTLGFLIPPSNIMIIYGVLGDVSIAKLFTAGFIRASCSRPASWPGS